MTSMTTRHFPILLTTADWRRYPDCPRSIPWHMLTLHEPQAWHNHRQSLASLARRGGLSPLEMKALLEGKRHAPPVDHDAEMVAAIEYLKDLISQHERPSMHRHELDEATAAFVAELQNQLPPHLTQFGPASTDRLRELARPHVEKIATADASAGAASKPFSRDGFLETARPNIGLIVSMVGAFSGAPAPAPAQAQKTEGQPGGAAPAPAQPANP